MVSWIDMYNREKQCTNSNGGGSELYLFPFIKYSRSKIDVSGNTITKFPYSVIYRLYANNISFNEDVTDEIGGLQSNQTLTYKLNKVTQEDDLKEFASYDWRAIVKDNNGYYRMMGVYNGIKGSYKKEMGENLNEYNGFNFSFDTLENEPAYYLNDLSDFSINENPLWTDLNEDFVVDLDDNKIEVTIWQEQ